MGSLSLGFSPCPNDTFIFYGLVHQITPSSVSFAKPLLEDVETLNDYAMKSLLDVTKLSFHALGHVLDDYCALQAGSALGRGCGPLLIATKDIDFSRSENVKVAIPGKYTTAALLFRMFAPQCKNLVETRFEQIMDSVANGEVDCGVIIHESRFTYQKQNLICLQDLGQWWEDSSGQPIPLGCIAAKRSLGEEKITAIDTAIKKSLEYSFANQAAPLPYIQTHSQELEEQVVSEHIKLYVNDFSLELGEEGRIAIETFLQRGRDVGILPSSSKPVFLK